jgi:hypothetical protein
MYSSRYSLSSKQITLSNKNIYRLFLICLIVDFGGAFGIRHTSLLLLLVLLLIKLANGSIVIPKRFLIVEGTIFFLIPIMLIAYSFFIYSIPLMTSLSEINSFFLWVVYLYLINLKSKQELIEPFKKIGFFCSLVVVTTFISLYVLISLGQTSIILEIQKITNDFRLGYIGLKPSEGGLYYIYSPNVYFRWSMILIPISIMFFSTKNKLKFLIIITSIFLITSTGIILFSLLGIYFYLLIDGFIRRNLGKNFTIAIIATCLLVLSSMLIDMSDITKKLSAESYSTSVKLGHIQSAIQEIFQNPNTFLFGTGIGASFYSIGINDYTTNIEVSHINLIRQCGILFSLLFFSYVIITFFKLLRTDDTGRRLGIGLISFFLCAGTNPLLLSPIFILFLIINRAYIEMHNKELQQKTLLQNSF